MRNWKRVFLVVIAAIMLTLAFIVFILPGILIDRAGRWVAEETGRVLEIEAVSINPFSLTASVRNLHLSDRDHSKPFISWDLLEVSLSMASLYHRAPVIDELHLEKPNIQLERLTQETFNFSDLLSPTGAEEQEQSKTEPFRFSINNVTIRDGSVDLADSSLKEQVVHKVRDLQLSLPTIGNLPYMVENPANPLFRAVINGSPIHLEGQLKPFTSSREMKFKLELNNLDLPYYLGYLPITLPVEIRNGRLSLDLDFLYRVSQESGGEFELSGQIDLASLDIWDRQQEKLFFLPLLQARIAPSQPIKRELHLSALRIYNLEVQLNRNRQGLWNHARMAEAEPAPEVPKTNGASSPPFKLLIDDFLVRDGKLFFADLLPAEPFKTVARQINIDIQGFSLSAEQGIPLNLSLKTDRNEVLTVAGQFMLDPFTLDLNTALQKVPLEAYLPYYLDLYRRPLAGTLDLEARVQVNPDQPLVISNGRLGLQHFYCAFNENEGVAIDQLDLAGLSFDLAENRLGLDTVASDGARFNFSRNNNGEWSFLSENFPLLGKHREDVEADPAQPAQGQEKAFDYHIGSVSIEHWNLAVHDEQPQAPADIEIGELALSIGNLSAPEKSKSPFTLTANFQGKGRIELSGSTTIADQKTEAAIGLKNIPLAALAPYLQEQVNLILADGALNARLHAGIFPAEGSFQAVVKGDLGIQRLHLLDARHREDLLKWETLQVSGIDGQLSPLRLGVEAITLSDYFAKIMIDQEGHLNLSKLLRSETKPPAEEPSSEKTQLEQSAAPATGKSSPPADISIGKVVLQGGRVDFTDRHLALPFHADMRELGGLIAGLSSSAESSAEVDLRGSLRNQSPLTISGTFNPLAEELSLALKLDFRDIELSQLSPYSGNFVGYLIEKGKLNLSLDYTIENHQLKASNAVFLDQFNFGKAFASEQATSLPVKLAVALLKDSRGEIHLDIPVHGSLDDPQFSIAGVVWTVIKNLLVKAATSPFALLGALVGGGEEDFSTITFDYGAPQLAPAEQEKLTHMAQALANRPALEVEIGGFIDPENDPEGYRHRQLALQVKRLKYLDLIKQDKLPADLTEEDVVLAEEEYADYLWQAYRQADFPKPRNLVGMTKKLPVAEMEKLIYANTAVGEEELAELAQARAIAVQNFLIEQGKIARERIFLKKTDIQAVADQGAASRARVELGALVR